MATQDDFVLDCSVAMAWCFDDEATLDRRRPRQPGDKRAVVPAISPLEASNATMRENARRLDEARGRRFSCCSKRCPSSSMIHASVARATAEMIRPSLPQTTAHTLHTWHPQKRAQYAEYVRSMGRARRRTMHDWISPFHSPPAITSPATAGPRPSTVDDALPDFPFVLRSDVKSYYASLDHELLLAQLHAAIADPGW